MVGKTKNISVQESGLKNQSIKSFVYKFRSFTVFLYEHQDVPLQNIQQAQ
jgi:hypothetical protein